MQHSIYTDSPHDRRRQKRFIKSSLYWVQSDEVSTAPKNFSTLLLWVRYRISAKLEKKCRNYFNNSLNCNKEIEDVRIIFVLHKRFTAFAYRIRPPPPEICFHLQLNFNLGGLQNGRKGKLLYPRGG